MSYRHLSRAIQLGIPAVRRADEAPPAPAPSAALLSHWRLDEMTLAGSPTPQAVDSEGLSNGLYVNATVGQTGLISGSPTGTSVRVTGDGYVRIPHVGGYEVDSYSVVVYAQIQTAPAASTNALLVHKDRNALPGGFQIGVWNNAGTIRPKLYTRNASGSPIYVGDVNGIPGASVSVGIAFMLVAVKTAAGVTVYLDKVEIGSQSNTVGWADNDEQFSIGIRRAGIQNTDGFNGWIDEVRVYEGALTQTEIDALPDAVTLVIPPDPPDPPEQSDQANCHVEPGLSTVVVSTMADLETQVNAAPAGRHILIAAGTYTGGTRVFNNNGTEANPIVIRPQGALGSVTINSATWSFANTSSWLTLSKLHFTATNIRLCGDHNRVTRCQFRNITRTCIQINDPSISTSGARNCRIDHCDFGGMNSSQNTNYIHYRSTHFANGSASSILIDYNYFHDITQHSGGLEQAVINSFTTLGAINRPRGSTLIFDHNLIENCRLAGSSELWTEKIGGIITRFCTFLNCPNEYMQSRTCMNNEYRSNWFENIDADGIHMWGKNHLCIGNRFVGAMDTWVPCGVGDQDDVITGAEPIDTYARAEGSRIIGNTMETGHILVGHYWPGTGVPTHSAINNVLEANVRTAGGNAHTLINTINGFSPCQVNTTINASTSEPFTAAVKLTSSDVGLNAADPLCS